MALPVHLPLQVLQRVVESIPTSVRSSIARELSTASPTSPLSAAERVQKRLLAVLHHSQAIIGQLKLQLDLQRPTTTATTPSSVSSDHASEPQGPEHLPQTVIGRWISRPSSRFPLPSAIDCLPGFGEPTRHEAPSDRRSVRALLPIVVHDLPEDENQLQAEKLERQLTPWLPTVPERVAVMDFRKGYHWIWRLTEQTRVIRRPYLVRLDLARVQPREIPDVQHNMRNTHRFDLASAAFETPIDSNSDAEV